MRLRRGHAWGAAATASAASPLLAQAGPMLDAEPLYLLIGGILGPGCTVALGEMTRAGVRATAAFIACQADGGTLRQCIGAAARTVLDDKPPQLPPPGGTDGQ